MNVALAGNLDIPELNLQGVSYSYEIPEKGKLGILRLIGISEDIYKKIKEKGIIHRAISITSKGKLTFFQLIFFDNNKPFEDNITLHPFNYCRGEFFVESSDEKNLSVIRFTVIGMDRWISLPINRSTNEKDRQCITGDIYEENYNLDGFSIRFTSSLVGSEQETGGIIIGRNFDVLIKKNDSSLNELVDGMYRFMDFLSLYSNSSFSIKDPGIIKYEDERMLVARYSGDIRDEYPKEVDNNDYILPIDFQILKNVLLHKYSKFTDLLNTNRLFIFGMLSNLQYKPFDGKSFFQMISNIENYLDTNVSADKPVQDTRFKIITRELSDTFNNINFKDEEEKSNFLELFKYFHELNRVNLRIKLVKLIEDKSDIHGLYITDSNLFIKSFLEKRNALAHSRLCKLTFDEELVLYNQVRILQFSLLLMHSDFNDDEIKQVIERILRNRVLGFDF